MMLREALEITNRRQRRHHNDFHDFIVILASIPITPSHHSDVLTSHPLLKLIHNPLTPNCYITPINIPEPTPHLHLFLIASQLITPYEWLYHAIPGHPYDPVRIQSPRFSRGPLAHPPLLLPNPPPTPPSRASTHID